MLQLFTASQAARELGVSTDRVRQLAREGVLHAQRVGSAGIRLFDPAEVERLARERATRTTRRSPARGRREPPRAIRELLRGAVGAS